MQPTPEWSEPKPLPDPLTLAKLPLHTHSENEQCELTQFASSLQYPISRSPSTATHMQLDPETSTESSYGVVPTSVGVLLGAVLGSLDGSELDIEPGAGLGVVVGEPDGALDGSADAMLLGSAVGSAE